MRKLFMYCERCGCELKFVELEPKAFNNPKLRRRLAVQPCEDCEKELYQTITANFENKTKKEGDQS